MKKRLAFLILFSLFFLHASAGRAFADSIGGLIELDYSIFDSKTTDSSGNTTKLNSHDFDQKYNLTLDKSIFPNLRLLAGGIFEWDQATLNTTNSKIKSTDTTINPYADLQLNTRLYNVMAGYNRREEKTTTSGSPSSTLVNEDYHARLGWRPEGLPTLNVQYTNTNTFDKAHELQDITNDNLLLSSKYTAMRGLDLNYQLTYNDLRDKLNDLGVTSYLHNAIATYSNVFFNRVFVNANYSFALRTTDTSQSGKGFVSVQLFPFAGLSLVTDLPIQGALSANPALIDGNLTASSGINIGLPPIVGGDTRPRNIGVDFFNATEVNELYVWVDRALPAQIASSFSWDIYISSDNQNWTFFQTLSSAPFGPFQNRFDLNFPNVTTRYIKVVVKPLSTGIEGATNFPDIFVTELQTFIKKPASQVSGTNTQINHLYNMNVRTKILDVPSLYYDFSLYLTNSSGTGISSFTRYTISNGLTAVHTFSRVFSGMARFARNDGYDINGSRVDYVYSASVTAVPFRTLRHTLVYSGQISQLPGRTNDSNAVVLNNSAELYRGINANASLGWSTNTDDKGIKNTSTTAVLGATVVPNRVVTLNLNYSLNNTSRTGPGIEGTDHTLFDRFDAGATYRPFETVYIVAEFGVVHQTGAKSYYLSNYGINWSPFPDGSLQLNFLYNDNFRSDTNSKERTLSPSLTWKISEKTTLQITYLRLTSSSIVQSSDSNILTGTLRVLL